ncbi:Imm8 family immunity protein [Thalassotalea sp. G2M2-11]|uniref:Imm8 family immunity protein n=1 Tax=Thalassotalea sp. G2M2-11 TaxID=2787627 RepID=UPI0019D121B1|nr:Imm8 family immunity protein [Thalassotalea sp. G2M2-11]
MKPEIKNYDCTDYDPIDTYQFNVPCDVDFWMNFTIGPVGFDGGDNFQVRVATYGTIGLKESIQYCILLDEYSFSQVLSKVSEFLAKSEGQNWDEVATKLAEYMLWEFQDYKPYNG